MPKIHNINKSSRKRTAALAAAFMMFTAFFTCSLSGCKPSENSASTGLDSSAIKQTSAETEPAAPVNPLTGLAGFSKTAAGKRPIAVVINNAPPARPQWGLCSPDIVVEGVVEGGVTRMLWLYSDINTIPKVGSMRSARHDFVEIAEGFNAVFIHWGHSIYAQEAMDERNVDDIEGKDYVGTYFFRDKSRNVAIEHTGYTTGESLSKAIANLNINTDINTAYTSPFQFTAEGKPETPAGGVSGSISFVFSQGYKHEFKFNASDKLYYNYLNSNPMVQDGGEQMAVTNVIVLYCGVRSMNDRAGCIDMDLTGGTGVFASNGGYENITWKKGGPGNMLKLYAPDGSEVRLNAGKSYIGFVPSAQSGKTVIA